MCCVRFILLVTIFKTEYMLKWVCVFLYDSIVRLFYLIIICYLTFNSFFFFFGFLFLCFVYRVFFGLNIVVFVQCMHVRVCVCVCVLSPSERQNGLCDAFSLSSVNIFNAMHMCGSFCSCLLFCSLSIARFFPVIVLWALLLFICVLDGACVCVYVSGNLCTMIMIIIT